MVGRDARAERVPVAVAAGAAAVANGTLTPMIGPRHDAACSADARFQESLDGRAKTGDPVYFALP